MAAAGVVEMPNELAALPVRGHGGVTAKEFSGMPSGLEGGPKAGEWREVAKPIDAEAGAGVGTLVHHVDEPHGVGAGVGDDAFEGVAVGVVGDGDAGFEVDAVVGGAEADGEFPVLGHEDVLVETAEFLEDAAGDREAEGGHVDVHFAGWAGGVHAVEGGDVVAEVGEGVIDEVHGAVDDVAEFAHGGDEMLEEVGFDEGVGVEEKEEVAGGVGGAEVAGFGGDHAPFGIVESDAVVVGDIAGLVLAGNDDFDGDGRTRGGGEKVIDGVAEDVVVEGRDDDGDLREALEVAAHIRDSTGTPRRWAALKLIMRRRIGKAS